MRQVAIVTDTTACVPPEQVSQYDIEVVPVPLIINQKTYRDGIDITPTEFYEMLRKAKRLPTTSASSPTPYFEAFRNASRRAPNILCLTEPSRFSAMYSSARAAVETAKEKLKNVAIEVMECTTAAAGQGLVALAAARAAAKGKSLAEVKQVVNNIMPRISLFAAIDNLRYLARSGRVPQVAAIVDTILSLKPVFTLNHANPGLAGLPRSIKGAIGRIIVLIKKNTHQGKRLHAAVMHADALEDAKILKEQITSSFNCSEIFITEFTPVMGVHTGPGLVGVAFYEE
ncbi:MAG: DegV family protein [Dehalococcoidales bacterium]|nr:DegV family protein [Dehalococcoidales bacterium]